MTNKKDNLIFFFGIAADGRLHLGVFKDPVCKSNDRTGELFHGRSVQLRAAAGVRPALLFQQGAELESTLVAQGWQQVAGASLKTGVDMLYLNRIAFDGGSKNDLPVLITVHSGDGLAGGRAVGHGHVVYQADQGTAAIQIGLLQRKALADGFTIAQVITNK